MADSGDVRRPSGDLAYPIVRGKVPATASSTMTPNHSNSGRTGNANHGKRLSPRCTCATEPSGLLNLGATALNQE